MPSTIAQRVEPPVAIEPRGPTQPMPSADRAESRGLSAWIQLAALACFAALATPFFVGRVYVADDLGEFHLPLRNFYAEQLARGEPFDWMSNLYGGFYVTAEGQTGGYHPLHLLLYRTLPLGAAFDLELLLSYPFMFGGAFLLFRRWLRRSDAALFGSLVFTFAGFNLLHFVHPNAVAVVAHIPWLLLAIDVTLTAATWRARAGAELAVGLLTASQLLLGYPQYVWFSLLVETAYAVWRSVAVHASLRTDAMLALAKLLGVLSAAVQLLPTMDALAGSLRRVPDVTFANTGSLHPLNLVQLLAPYLFETRVAGQNTHELGLYAGAVPCLLCIWLAAHRQNWGRLAPLIRAAIGFGVLALLLAMGDAGVLYRLQTFLPLVNRFRFPCRAIVLVQFCLAVGAAAALAILLQGIRRRASAIVHADEAWPRDRSLAIAFVVSVGLAIAGPLLWPDYVAGTALVWCGPLLIGVGAMLIVLAERGVRGALVAMVLFTALDLSVYGLSYSVYPHTADLREFVAQSPVPPSSVDGGIRVVAPQSAGGARRGDRMLLAGVHRIDGYAGLEPAKRLDDTTIAAMQLAGANWVLSRDQTWTRIAPTAPRARLVTQTDSGDPWKAPHAISDAATLDTALVDEPLVLPRAAPGSAVVAVDLPGRITIDTRAATPQLLVTTESFHSGWQAVVDGREQAVVRVNGDFLGSVVPAGDHQVELRFRPRSLLAGKYASACGLGLLVCIFGVPWCRRKSAV